MPASNAKASAAPESTEQELVIGRTKLEDIEMDDEAKLLEGLADLGITPEHPRYNEILKIWRDAR